MTLTSTDLPWVSLIISGDVPGFLHRSLVLHPSFKLSYFEKAEWPQLWINDALSIARTHWARFKPTGAARVAQAPVSPPFMFLAAVFSYTIP